MERLFENLFKWKLRKTKQVCNEFLREISLPILNQEAKKVCDEEISEQVVILALKSFSNNKSPENDGLTKEFYETFWEELKQPFMNLLNQAKVSKKLVTYQRQAVIKFLASTLKKILPNLISSQQTAYIAQGCINESGRVISDLLSVTKKVKVKGYLVTIDIEKAFDSLDSN